MKIKKVIARVVRDSRGEKTIKVIVKTSEGKFKTASPSGKSTGKYEVKPYKKSLKEDIRYINKLDIRKINSLGIDHFEDLKWIERLVFNDIGGNSLFALEASLLKALAKDKGKELWEFLGGKKIPKSIGNAIGGGLHSKGVKGMKPDFQEFHFIAKGKTFSESVKLNEIAYNLVGRLLKARRRNDEGAWETSYNNKWVLRIMREVQNIIKKKDKKHVDLGLDIAASAFYEKNYNYENPEIELNSKEQIDYVNNLINDYNIFYVEDPLNESDFSGFGRLLKKVGNANCLVVGDDLTTTNLERFNKAIKRKSINAIIVKPNQIGSLLEVKEVIDLAKKHKIKTIISHRSGETEDDTIADLAVGWQVDFIKTGIYGKVRKAKLNRIIEIERKINSRNNRFINLG